MRKQMRLGLAGLGLGWMAVSYAEPVTLVRETALRAEPSLFAATVATVAKGVTGESIGKSGIWVHVKTPDQSGWVFTFNLRHGGPRTGSAGASSAQAAGRFVSARPRTQVVSTIGIRGLSEEDLQNATFNRAEMERLKSLSASAQDGEQHARALGLEPARIDELDAQ